MSFENFDVVVIGGGVGGLSAAISFNRQELNVLLLEQDNEFGKRIKGEVINKSAEIFKKIFNQDELPNSISRIVYKSAKYYTPSSKKHALRLLPSGEKIGIEYRQLVDELLKIIISEGGIIKLNSEVKELIQRDEEIIGLKYQEFDQITEIFPKLIICAIGFHSKLKLPPQLNRPKYICPAIKIVAEGLNIPDRHELEFFLLNIPSVIWIFPKLHDRAELGITLWMDHEQYELKAILDEAAQTHPILKERLSKGTPIYHSSEILTFGGPLKRSYFPNMFVIGDAMGHVGAIGGSGIISSMTIGYQLGEILGKTLKATGKLQPEDFDKAQRFINESPIGKWLKKEQSSAKAMREILYKPRKSPDEIDALWDKFKGFIENRRA